MSEDIMYDKIDTLTICPALKRQDRDLSCISPYVCIKITHFLEISEGTMSEGLQATKDEPSGESTRNKDTVRSESV